MKHLRRGQWFAPAPGELTDPPVKQGPEILELSLDAAIAAQRHVRPRRILPHN